MIIYGVNVLMGSTAPYQGPEIKCNDTGVNICVFPEISIKLSRLREKREPYKIPPDCTAVLKVAKKDNTFALCDGKIKGNSMLFRLPPQACTTVGEAKAEVNIFNAVGDRVTTGTFPITITKEAVSEHSQDSEMYVDILADYIRETTEAKEEAEAAAENSAKAKEEAETAAKNSAKAAAKAEAAQVNTPIIGDNGNWYIWDAKAEGYKDSGVKAQGPAPDTDHFATKEELKNKVDKIVSPKNNVVYVETQTGNTTGIEYATKATRFTIVQRHSLGEIYVRSEPTFENEAVGKGYVDSTIKSAISEALEADY